jgi:hypothetical protein
VQDIAITYYIMSSNLDAVFKLEWLRQLIIWLWNPALILTFDSRESSKSHLATHPRRRMIFLSAGFW